MAAASPPTRGSPGSVSSSVWFIGSQKASARTPMSEPRQIFASAARELRPSTLVADVARRTLRVGHTSLSQPADPVKSLVREVEDLQASNKSVQARLTALEGVVAAQSVTRSKVDDACASVLQLRRSVESRLSALEVLEAERGEVPKPVDPAAVLTLERRERDLTAVLQRLQQQVDMLGGETGRAKTLAENLELSVRDVDAKFTHKITRISEENEFMHEESRHHMGTYAEDFMAKFASYECKSEQLTQALRQALATDAFDARVAAVSAKTVPSPPVQPVSLPDRLCRTDAPSQMSDDRFLIDQKVVQALRSVDRTFPDVSTKENVITFNTAKFNRTELHDRPLYRETDEMTVLQAMSVQSAV
mmetsp:Transcript_60125/g.159972  ORF Transcript_60125/g.159972 Transcript_60125/m.159972 type:complete len:362 (-) Transcript_60125:281-1366(-)